MVYFLHKLTFSSSETFLKSITKISCSIDQQIPRQTDVCATDRSRHAAGECSFRLFLHDVCIQHSKMEDQDRGFRRGRGGRRRERGFRERPARVSNVTLNC